MVNPEMLVTMDQPEIIHLETEVPDQHRAYEDEIEPHTMDEAYAPVMTEEHEVVLSDSTR